MSNELKLPVNEVKVIDRVIDIYLWIAEDLNTAEVLSLAQHLTDLANRRATDVELYYQCNRISDSEDFEYICEQH